MRLIGVAKQAVTLTWRHVIRLSSCHVLVRVCISMRPGLAEIIRPRAASKVLCACRLRGVSLHKNVIWWLQLKLSIQCRWMLQETCCM